jgi:hypothetical protein
MATDLATVHHFPPRIKFDQMPQLLKLRKGEFQSLGNAWDVLGFSKKGPSGYSTEYYGIAMV